MKIKEILDHLTYSELSQHIYGGYKHGAMQNEHVPKVVSILNQGLREINQKVDWLQGSVHMEMYPWRTTYRLHKRFAKANVSSDLAMEEKYIQDFASMPFTHDVRRVTSVSMIDGREVNIFKPNIREHNHGIEILTHDSVEVPHPIPGRLLHAYFSYHPFPIMAETMQQAEDEEFDYPLDALAALYAYVEFKMTAGMNVQQDMGDDNAKYQLYIAELQELINNPITPTRMVPSDSFSRGGWI